MAGQVSISRGYHTQCKGYALKVAAANSMEPPHSMQSPEPFSLDYRKLGSALWRLTF